MQDAQTANQQFEAAEAAAAKPTPLPLRNDTLLGICEGLGEDFGFNPLPLRVALAAGLLWNPVAVVGIYLGLGLLVAVSRYFFPPVGNAAAAPAAAVPAPADAPAEAVEAEEEERELIAA